MAEIGGKFEALSGRKNRIHARWHRGMNGRVVAITGASAGVGRACAKLFASYGYDVGLIARGSAGLDAASKEVETEGRRGAVSMADVSDAEQLERAAREIEDTLGPIDVWVNNAMTTVFSRFVDLTSEEFRRVTEVTYLGVVYGTLTALRLMVPRNHGVIVQVGSALSYRGVPLQSAYCGAKHAIKGFTESVRTELMHDKSNVQLTMVQLPAINTPQFDWSRSKMEKQAQPIPPIYQPEVAAEAIVWAAQHPRREVQVASPTVGTVLGNKLVPGVLDAYLSRRGFESQQTEERESKRDDNLVSPLDGEKDFGAHGRFNDRSHGSSALLWATTHRLAVAAAAGSIAGVVALRRKS
jgi:short-subunit dehydrogenase